MREKKKKKKKKKNRQRLQGRGKGRWRGRSGGSCILPHFYPYLPTTSLTTYLHSSAPITPAVRMCADLS